MRVGLVTLIIIAGLSSMVYAQEDELIIRPDIFFLNWSTFEESEHQSTWGIIQLVDDFMLSKNLAYEFRLSPFRYIQFHETDKSYVAATPLAWAGLIALPAYYTAIFGEKKWVTKYLIPGLILPFGSHLVVTPKVGLHIFAGMITDVIFFTEDNGILFQLHGGLRMYSQPGFSLSLSVVHHMPVVFDQYTRSSTGIGIEIGYNFYDHSPIW
jgi:hypothetical protein